MAAISHAQAAENVRLRGTIVSLEGSTLTVKTREGPDARGRAQARMEGHRRRQGVDRRHQAGGFCRHRFPADRGGRRRGGRSADFPPAMKGTGEGSYPWDLKPKSTMTNATVANAVKEVDGRTLTSPTAAVRRRRSQFRTARLSSPSPLRQRPTSSPARRSSFPPNAATMAPCHGVRRRRRKWGCPADVGRGV